MSEFLSDRSKCMHVGSVLRPLLFILYTTDLFRIAGNHIVDNADDTTIYAVIPRPLSGPQEIESLNHNLAAIYSAGV